MLKELPLKKRALFIGSLILNVVLILYVMAGFLLGSYVEKSGVTDIAEYNAIKDKMCEQNYQRILDGYDNQYASDPKRAHDAKNSFAINVCLRNYKTGEQLNLKPLIDQVR